MNCAALILCLSLATDPSHAPEGMVLIPAGEFVMGSLEGNPDEQPMRTVSIDAFYLDTHEVTNAQFAAFVEATGYVTEAEEWGWSLVFAADDRVGQRVLGASWWLKVDGADWRHPDGPNSSIVGKDDHPVVQVSWNDAVAYATWAGKRLPTEAEWEYAARAAPIDESDPKPFDRTTSANTWTGEFPVSDGGEDGFSSRAPVGSFPPNARGLYDMAGNVWEWCADWYHAGYYRGGPTENPKGPETGSERVLRGGSWMCASNYCRGYRPTHRNSAAPDSGLPNTGFRCALDATQ